MAKTPTLPEPPQTNVVIALPGVMIEIPGSLAGFVIVAAMVISRLS
ncbi:MAG: hypothetical protein WBL06_08720 [Pseudolysinimonas sp.]